MGSGKHSPPRRRGREARAREGEASREAAPSEAKAQTGWREARARQGEAPIKDRPARGADLTTPALLLRLRPIGLALRGATPPLRGGE